MKPCLIVKKALILAGGSGERLKSRVPTLPKPLAPINGRPFLEYILDKLCQTHLTDVILSVGYKADLIQKHFGPRYQSLSITYSEECAPLGTGGAIALALQNEDESPVLVLNGDSLVDENFEKLIEWYERESSVLGVILRHVPDRSRYGTAILSGDRVVDFQEKGTEGPGLANAGIYFIQPTLFSLYPMEGFFSFEVDILQRYCQEVRPRAFVSNGTFIDIGTPEDYDRAQEVLAPRENP